jgi:cytochrome c-type biogenesis protein CcmH/NrfG
MRVLLASVITVILATAARPAVASEASRAKAKEAMQLCSDVERLPADDKEKKLDVLARGIAAGQAAVAADDADARAHLALFCNLGKQLELAGLSWRALGRMRAAQAEIDRALELAPADPDVLVAKGQMLRRMPGPLGGDKVLGERLLLRALEIKPDHVEGRLYLAQAIAERGEPEARARAYEALALARKAGTPRDESEAEELIASLPR